MKLSSSLEVDWSTPQQPIPQTISQGTVEYKRAGMALFLLGFASFSLIYCVQPLLPNLSQSFHIAPSASALALSLTTGFLAMSIVAIQCLFTNIGQKRPHVFLMLLASILNVVCAVSPSWHVLMVSRSLEGFVLGGVPAVAMAWIAEEISPKNLSKTMGLYIAGTAFGGMMGRVGMGILTEFFSWRISMAILGGICLFCAFGFLKLLPNSRNFIAQQGLSFKFHLHAWYAALKSYTAVRKSMELAFYFTSVFVTLFNYVTFRLFAAPYHLSQTQISLIFLSYSLGIISSSIAGNIADRIGKKQVMILGFLCMLLGVLLTLSASLFLIILGIGCVTTGFFIAHAIASSRVGELATSQ